MRAVGYDLVRRAAREAADLFDTLIICGFAFAPEVDETRLNFGALTVLKARMNQDLRMADKLIPCLRHKSPSSSRPRALSGSH
jgi:adenine-specific DNA-methyltransferase